MTPSGSAAATVNAVRPAQRESNTVSLSSQARAAWAISFLADLPPATREELLGGALEMCPRPGQILYGGASRDELPGPALVVSGVIRIAASTSQGRELTISHATSGTVVGIAETVMSSSVPVRPATEGCAVRAEACQESRILRLNPQRFRRAMSDDATTALAVIRYLTGEYESAQRSLAFGVFLSVRARVAHHLLDIADMTGPFSVARTTHREIANAVGSVREVVSRTVQQLQNQGLVRQESGQRLLLIEPEALLRLT